MTPDQADPREAILDRLIVLFKTILPQTAGKDHVFRNRLNIPDELLPAIAVLDGDEDPDGAAYERNRPANTPVIVTMTPEIYAFTADKPAAVGSGLNALRRSMVKAIMNDETLLGLCHNGDIRYLGYSTGLANGRSLEGELGIAFAFVYVLRPGAL